MPEGYEDAIMLALAIRMAPGYGKQVNPDTKQAARRAMNAIKVTNQVIPTMDLPDAVMGRSGSSFASFMSGVAPAIVISSPSAKPCPVQTAVAMPAACVSDETDFAVPAFRRVKCDQTWLVKS